MARLPRLVLPGFLYHITHKGNNREAVFLTDEDRLAYFDLMRYHSRLAGVDIFGFCLMTNHVHFIARPEREDSLAQWIRRAHAEYAQNFNRRRGRSGHLWQNRFYSCMLERAHVINALRYVDLNPVRARLTETAVGWPWSSAIGHVRGEVDEFGLLTREWLEWRDWPDWAASLTEGENVDFAQMLRKCTRTNRPLGSTGFIEGLERATDRKLFPGRSGRPRLLEAAVGRTIP